MATLATSVLATTSRSWFARSRSCNPAAFSGIHRGRSARSPSASAAMPIALHEIEFVDSSRRPRLMMPRTIPRTPAIVAALNRPTGRGSRYQSAASRNPLRVTDMRGRLSITTRSRSTLEPRARVSEPPESPGVSIARTVSSVMSPNSASAPTVRGYSPS